MAKAPLPTRVELPPKVVRPRIKGHEATWWIDRIGLLLALVGIVALVFSIDRLSNQQRIVASIVALVLVWLVMFSGPRLWVKMSQAQHYDELYATAEQIREELTTLHEQFQSATGEIHSARERIVALETQLAEAQQAIESESRRAVKETEVGMERNNHLQTELENRDEQLYALRGQAQALIDFIRLVVPHELEQSEVELLSIRDSPPSYPLVLRNKSDRNPKIGDIVLVLELDGAVVRGLFEVMQSTAGRFLAHPANVDQEWWKHICSRVRLDTRAPEQCKAYLLPQGGENAA